MFALVVFFFSCFGILAVLVIGKVVLVPVVRYNLLRSKYAHIPRNFGRELFLPMLNIAIPDGYFSLLDALKDSKGKSLLITHFGPEMDGGHKIAITDPQVLFLFSNSEQRRASMTF